MSQHGTSPPSQLEITEPLNPDSKVSVTSAWVSVVSPRKRVSTATTSPARATLPSNTARANGWIPRSYKAPPPHSGEVKLPHVGNGWIVRTWR